MKPNPEAEEPRGTTPEVPESAKLRQQHLEHTRSKKVVHKECVQAPTLLGSPDPIEEEALDAKTQEAEPREQEAALEEMLSSGRFLPAEAEERPEPFATIADLVGEYGIEEVLQAISDHALFDSENPEACSCCWPTHGDSADERLHPSKEKAGMQA
jgi:hypothetical protein